MTNPILILNETFDELRLLQEEVLANEDCWGLDTSRQDRIACQRDTQTIFLRVAATAKAPGVANAMVHACRDSNISIRFPRTMDWLEGFAASLNGQLGRVFLVRIKPRGQVYPHSDRGDYYKVRHRYHVLLNADNGSLDCDGERCLTGTGQIIWFDNKCEYEETNHSDYWSIRLIVDVLPPVKPPIPSVFKNFALMKAGIDVAPLLEEVESQSHLWDIDTRRQERISVQRETSHIPLRGAAMPIPRGIDQINWHRSQRTLFAEHCPRIYSWVDQFACALGGTLSRVAVVRLNPKGKVYPHIDEGEYYRVRDRYHLVLRSPGGSEMNSGGEKVVFHDGEVWWFNNKAFHDAFNPSDHGRIHVIFDVLPSRPTVSVVEKEPVEGPLPFASPKCETATPFPSAKILSRIEAALSRTARVPCLRRETGMVQIEFRNSGRLVARGDSQGTNYWEGLRGAIAQGSQRGDLALANEVMLSFGGTHRPLNLREERVWQRLLSPCWRGLYGYEVRHVRNAGVSTTLSPFEFVATNRSFPKAFEKVVERWGLSVEEAIEGGVTLHEFETRRFRLTLGGDSAVAESLIRGSKFVPLEAMTPYSVRSLQDLLSDYLERSVQSDGRMVYLYYPSRGSEDLTRNNAIRQWMATRALIRVADRQGTNSLREKIKKNIGYNLTSMYSEEDGLGLIHEGSKVKLGAVALAALALTECPFSDEFLPIRDKLAATVDRLWKEDGSFQTFYRPAERDDCQNFYPGEALLFWAKRLHHHNEPHLFDRFQKSVRYYWAWHLANRNPAFIPWHTQAYFKVWEQTQSPELAELIFQMNDWLLEVQQWERAPHPDCLGRFYDPGRPFGPPHASSTAVYLEGLADAFALARRLGDENRAKNYRQSILRGLRSLSQLTFKDDFDLFYISKRSAVRGGVQTAEYDNTIRVDNVQHALAAIHKVLEYFSPGDYSLG